MRRYGFSARVTVICRNCSREMTREVDVVLEEYRDLYMGCAGCRDVIGKITTQPHPTVSFVSVHLGTVLNIVRATFSWDPSP